MKAKRLKCKKCFVKWYYKVINKIYATCPDCHASNKIKEVTV